jgi:FixJ family two-component response regulator
MSSDGAIYVVDNDQRAIDAVSALAKSLQLQCKAYTSGLKLLQEIEIDRPGCLISEIRIPDIGGLQLQRRLQEMDATTPVIFLTAYSSVPIVVRAMKAGAFHFFEKPIDEQTLWEVVQDAISYDQSKCREKQKLRTLRDRLALLKETEREVLDLVLQGIPNRVIAEEQQVSVRTVELRRGRVMEKLGASTLAELVCIGLVANSNGAQDAPLPEAMNVP